MANLLRALRLPWRCAPLLAVLQLLAAFAGGLFPVAAADLTAVLIDRLGGGHGARDIGWLTAAVVGVTAGGALLQHANRYAGKELARRIDIHTQQELFLAVTNLGDLARLEDPPFHNRVRLAQQASMSGPQQLVTTVLSILQTSISTLGFLISCISFAPFPAALLLASAAPGVVAQRRLCRKRSGATVASAPHLRRQLFYAQLLLDLRAAKEIRLFGLGPRLLRRLRLETGAAQQLDRAVDRSVLRTDILLSLLTAAASGAALAVVIYDLAHGHGSVGELAVLIAALTGVQGGSAAIVAQFANLSQTLTLFQHYTELVDAEKQRRADERARQDSVMPVGAAEDAGRPERVERPESGIRFHSVWFRYHEEAPWVLRDLDLRLPPDTTVGLVGLNGAGKSTLAKLLCRLYTPTRGRITWDGVDLRDIETAELRSRISAVFQDFMAYDLSAHDNIAVAGPDAGPEAPDVGFGVPRSLVTAAAETAGAHELLSGLPDGYDSMLSRIFADDAKPASGRTMLGMLLSGGQWQRLALARAAMRGDARLFILDEPSASLDPQSEATQRTRLHALLEGRIGLLISHRLDGIRQAGLIIVLSDGAITEQGTHEELIELDGDYARLFHLQARGYAETLAPAADDRYSVA